MGKGNVEGATAIYGADGVGIKPNPAEIGIGFLRGGVRLGDGRKKTWLTNEWGGPGCQRVKWRVPVVKQREWGGGDASAWATTRLGQKRRREIG